MTEVTDLADRYGSTRPRHRWAVVAVGGGLALALLAVVLWSFLAQADPEVRSRLTRYDVASPREASADIEVVRADGDVTASCLVQALAVDHTVVGEETAVVDSGPTSQTLRVRVRTEREAVSVVSRGCTSPGQKRPR